MGSRMLNGLIALVAGAVLGGAAGAGFGNYLNSIPEVIEKTRNYEIEHEVTISDEEVVRDFAISGAVLGGLIGLAFGAIRSFAGESKYVSPDEDSSPSLPRKECSGCQYYKEVDHFKWGCILEGDRCIWDPEEENPI